MLREPRRQRARTARSLSTPSTTARSLSTRCGAARCDRGAVIQDCWKAQLQFNHFQYLLLSSPWVADKEKCTNLQCSVSVSVVVVDLMYVTYVTYVWRFIDSAPRPQARAPTVKAKTWLLSVARPGLAHGSRSRATGATTPQDRLRRQRPPRVAHPVSCRELGCYRPRCRLPDMMIR